MTVRKVFSYRLEMETGAGRFARASRNATRPVSRVLYPLPRVMAIHLWAPVAKRLMRPTRTARLETGLAGCPAAPPLFGLAPGGVCPAAAVARGAVRSYRTLSPLPDFAKGSGGRFAFCGTFPGVAPAGGYPAPRFQGARTFLSAASYAGNNGAAIRPADSGNKGICAPHVKRIKGLARGFVQAGQAFSAMRAVSRN